MPHLQAYAALWLIIQMALGREREMQGASRLSHLPAERTGYLRSFPPRFNKDFVIHLCLMERREQVFFNINTVILDENERGSAQTTLGGAVNKLLCLEIDTLHYRMNWSLVFSA